MLFKAHEGIDENHIPESCKDSNYSYVMTKSYDVS